ncbi:MAG: SDR family oxidoreductase [Lentisphaerae bacterium]|nr:SDR family oxidoreductase [Lentisphaerota bacterium]
MIEAGKTYVVMGLLDSDSIAYAIGKRIGDLGGRVIYTVQSERMKSIFLDRSDKRLPAEEIARLDIRFCDVTVDEQIAALFAGTGPVAGIVHSIAYANPRTCLGEEFHTGAIDDLKMAYHISCASLARVAFHAKPVMADGGSLVAMTFDAARAYAYYNWMGVNKAALEALVRALARRHGRDLIRVNAVSAGPLHSKAASKIPGFNKLHRIWRAVSPLPWDVEADKDEVAHMAVFLLGPLTRKVTGQVIHVDGGASVVAGMLMPFEQWQYPTALTDDPHEEHTGPVLRA